MSESQTAPFNFQKFDSGLSSVRAMNRWGRNDPDDSGYNRPGRSGGREVPPPAQFAPSGPLKGNLNSSLLTAHGRNSRGYSLAEHDKFLATAVIASNSASVLQAKKKKDYFDEVSEFFAIISRQHVLPTTQIFPENLTSR